MGFIGYLYIRKLYNLKNKQTAIVKRTRENYESQLSIEEIETINVFGMEPPMPSSVRTN